MSAGIGRPLLARRLGVGGRNRTAWPDLTAVQRRGWLRIALPLRILGLKLAGGRVPRRVRVALPLGMFRFEVPRAVSPTAVLAEAVVGAPVVDTKTKINMPAAQISLKIAGRIAEGSNAQKQVSEQLLLSVQQIGQTNDRTAAQIGAQNLETDSLLASARRLVESVNVFKLPQAA